MCLLSCCFTSTEARWPIRDGDRVGRGRETEASTAETVRKRPERPWTAARTMEVLRRCPLAIAQRFVHRAVAVSTAVLDRVTKTMSVALLLTNNLDNSKQKTSNLLSPAPPPYSWSLLGKLEGPAPPPSSKISWSFDLAWNPECACSGPWPFNLSFVVLLIGRKFYGPNIRCQHLRAGPASPKVAGDVWKSGRSSWAPVPNTYAYGFCGRKATLSQPLRPLSHSVPAVASTNQEIVRKLSIFLYKAFKIRDTVTT